VGLFRKRGRCSPEVAAVRPLLPSDLGARLTFSPHRRRHGTRTDNERGGNRRCYQAQPRANGAAHLSRKRRRWLVCWRGAEGPLAVLGGNGLLFFARGGQRFDSTYFLMTLSRGNPSAASPGAPHAPVTPFPVLTAEASRYDSDRGRRASTRAGKDDRDKLRKGAGKCRLHEHDNGRPHMCPGPLDQRRAPYSRALPGTPRPPAPSFIRQSRQPGYRQTCRHYGQEERGEGGGA
jgi:hypothetical protein